MKPVRVIAGTVALGAALAGCTSTSTTTTSTPPTGSPTPAATSSSSAAAGGVDASGSASTTLDPCQLVTQQEASALIGVSYGPGRPESDPGGAKRCVYGYQTKNVFLVIVVQGSSVEQVQAEKDKIRAEAEQQLGAQITLTKVSGVGDDAEFLQAPLNNVINVSGLYVVKGTVGFALVDTVAGGTAPGQAALTTQANTVLGRLP